MIVVLITAYFLGMAAAIPVGPVGSLLLRIPDRKWFACLGSLLVLDLVVAFAILTASELFLKITSTPMAKIASGLFLLIFSLQGLIRQRQHRNKVKVKSESKVRQVVAVATANPGTYLMMASAFLFLNMAAAAVFWEKLLILAVLSVGSLTWYHLVRHIFLKQSAVFQYRFERIIYLVIGAAGAGALFTALGREAKAASPSPLPCRVVLRHGASVRRDCSVNFSNGSKVIHNLTLEGNGAQISYDHGYLLAVEAEKGVLAQTHTAIEEGLNSGPVLGRGIKKQIFSCMYERVRKSLGQDFMADIAAFHEGYASRMQELGKRPKFSQGEVLRASLAIELSIIMEGLAARSARNKNEVLSEMASQCGIRIPFALADEIFGLVNPFKHGGLKLGCIGGILPKEQSAQGSLVHIRNLDGNLVETWNKAPVIAMVKRHGSQPFVAGATAGLIYLGGISGYNQSGISASLHEMSTERYQSSHGRGILAPYMMQKIFEEARSLDGAIDLIKSFGHFGAWTFLLADSKTGETASVEVSGFKVSVARRTRFKPMAQSNHFFGKGMEREAFTYSFNKFLESWSRFHYMESSLKKFAPGSASVEHFVDILSGHQDIYEGRRAFGRTATKAYTIMSTIAVPQAHEFWVTLGERMPASHSNFTGFEVNFDKGTLEPIRALRTSQFAQISPWEQSLQTYVDARVAYVHDQKPQAIELMKRAKAQALKSGIKEPVYLYILGRLYLETKQHDLAAKEFNELVAQTNGLHDYGKAMLGLMQMANMVELGYPRNETFQGYAVKTQKRLWDLYKKHGHPDLKKKIDLYDQMMAGKKIALPEIDFVTVE